MRAWCQVSGLNAGSYLVSCSVSSELNVNSVSFLSPFSLPLLKKMRQEQKNNRLMLVFHWLKKLIVQPGRHESNPAPNSDSFTQGQCSCNRSATARRTKRETYVRRTEALCCSKWFVLTPASYCCTSRALGVINLAVAITGTISRIIQHLPNCRDALSHWYQFEHRVLSGSPLKSLIHPSAWKWVLSEVMPQVVSAPVSVCLMRLGHNLHQRLLEIWTQTMTEGAQSFQMLLHLVPDSNSTCISPPTTLRYFSHL